MEIKVRKRKRNGRTDYTFSKVGGYICLTYTEIREIVGGVLFVFHERLTEEDRAKALAKFNKIYNSTSLRFREEK